MEEFVQGTLVAQEQTRVVDGVEAPGYVMVRRGGWLRTAEGRALLACTLFDCTEDELEAAYAAKRAEFDHLISLTIAESVKVAELADSASWKAGEVPKNL